jgi:hypothetical protein
MNPLILIIILLVSYFTANEIMFIWDIHIEQKIKKARKPRNQTFKK